MSQNAATPAFAAPSALQLRRPLAAHVTPARTGASAARCAAQAPMPRRAFLSAAAAALAGGLLVRDASAKTVMTGDYKVDAALVLSDMRTACDLARGAPDMAATVTKTRREMNDFVALYRRNDKVSGSTSFSTLYTAINTLSGHYASYGNAYPVPEKRKKRLTQQFSEIDRALNRGR